MKVCEICGNKYYAKGFCKKHYTRNKYYGGALKRTKFDPNEYRVIAEIVEMKIYNNSGKVVGKALFDLEYLDKVKKYKWRFDNKGYVIGNGGRLYLHHLILGRKKGFVVDHINHRKFDNRKQNLRFATKSQNTFYKKKKALGVNYDKKNKNWRAEIRVNGKGIWLGSYKDKRDALVARKKAEEKYYKHFV